MTEEAWYGIKVQSTFAQNLLNCEEKYVNSGMG